MSNQHLWQILAEAMPRFCPHCWEDVSQTAARCPHCGQDVAQFWEGKDDVERLLLALTHPDSIVAAHAAWLLGHLQDRRAVGHLIRLSNSTDDAQLARRTIQALGELGGDEAERWLGKLVEAGGALQRSEALTALDEIRHRVALVPATWGN